MDRKNKLIQINLFVLPVVLLLPVAHGWRNIGLFGEKKKIWLVAALDLIKCLKRNHDRDCSLHEHCAHLFLSYHQISKYFYFTLILLLITWFFCILVQYTYLPSRNFLLLTYKNKSSVLPNLIFFRTLLLYWRWCTVCL